MEQLGEGFQDREEMFDAAKPMAADYPLFGTGPGTFGTVFQLYLISNCDLLAGTIAQRLARNPHHVWLGGNWRCCSRRWRAWFCAGLCRAAFAAAGGLSF